MHPMNDPLDDEIRRALAVGPSPEFLARVRTKIASEPASTAHRPWQVLASVAAAFALVLLAVALWPRAPQTRQTAAPTVLGAKPIAGVGALVPARRPAPPEPDARWRGPERRTREPEVLIAAGEARAMRALILAVRDGRIDLAPALGGAAIAAAPSLPIETIDIQPITIAPIAPLSGEEGVRQ